MDAINFEALPLEQKLKAIWDVLTTKPKEVTSEYITLKQVKELGGPSRSTLNKIRVKGKEEIPGAIRYIIKGKKDYRYNRQDILNWINL